MSSIAEPCDVDVIIPAGRVRLPGTLCLPEHASGLVLFAHGSGSSRLSARNNRVAGRLRGAGMGTLLFDLLTEPEGAVRRNAFAITLLAERLLAATRWLHRERPGLPIGYFGASTGGAAALVAAADRPDLVDAVVSRGGRPDLARDALPRVTAATLLIVGGDDPAVLQLNRDAFAQLRSIKRLEIIPGASHLFEEGNTLDEVADLAGRWFAKYLAGVGLHPALAGAESSLLGMPS